MSDDIYSEIHSTIASLRARHGLLRGRRRALCRACFSFNVTAPFGGGKTQGIINLEADALTDELLPVLYDMARSGIYVAPTRALLISASVRALRRYVENIRTMWGHSPEHITWYVSPPPEVRAQISAQMPHIFILVGTDLSCVNEKFLSLAQEAAHVLAVRLASEAFLTAVRLLGELQGIGEAAGSEIVSRLIRNTVVALAHVSGRTPEEVAELAEQLEEMSITDVEHVFRQLLEELRSRNVLHELESLVRAVFDASPEARQGYIDLVLETYRSLVRELRRGLDVDEQVIRLISGIMTALATESSNVFVQSYMCAACPLKDRTAVYRMLDYIFDSDVKVVNTMRRGLGTPEEAELSQYGFRVCTGLELYEECRRALGVEACPYKAAFRLFLREREYMEKLVRRRRELQRRGELPAGMPLRPRILYYLTNQMYASSTVARVIQDTYAVCTRRGISVPHLVVQDEAEWPLFMPFDSVYLPYAILQYGSARELSEDIARAMRQVGLDPGKTGTLLLRRVCEKVYGELLEVADRIEKGAEEVKLYGVVSDVKILDDIVSALARLRNIHSEWMISAHAGLREFAVALSSTAASQGFEAVREVFGKYLLCAACVTLVDFLKEIDEELITSGKIKYWIDVPRLHLSDIEVFTTRREERLGIYLVLYPLLILKRMDVVARYLLDHTYPYPARIRIRTSATMTRQIVESVLSATHTSSYLEKISDPYRKPYNLTRIADIEEQLQGRAPARSHEWIEIPRGEVNPYVNVYLFLAFCWLDAIRYAYFYEVGRSYAETRYVDPEVLNSLYSQYQLMTAAYGMRKSDMLALEAGEFGGAPGYVLAQIIFVNMLQEMYSAYDVLRRFFAPGYTADRIFCFLIFGTCPQLETVVGYLQTSLSAGPLTVPNTPLRVAVHSVDHYRGRRDLVLVSAEVEGLPVDVLMTYARGREGRGVDIDVVARELTPPGERVLIMSYVVSPPYREPLSLYAAEVWRSSQLLDVEMCDAVTAEFQAAFRVVRALVYEEPRLVLIDYAALPSRDLVMRLPSYLRLMIQDAVTREQMTYVAMAYTQLLHALGIPVM